VKRKCSIAVVILFAIIGLCSVALWGYEAFRAPHVVARPGSFLIVDINSAADPTAPRARVFLDDVSNPAEIRFEGAGLKWQEAKLHYERSTIPMNGFIVVGVGSIVYGHSRIDLDSDRILINGTDVHPTEFTVARNGAFRRGDIRINR
jgi:hypothetical protein